MYSKKIKNKNKKEGEDEKAKDMLTKLDAESRRHVYSLTVAHTLLSGKPLFTRKELIMLKKFASCLSDESIDDDELVVVPDKEDESKDNGDDDESDRKICNSVKRSELSVANVVALEFYLKHMSGNCRINKYSLSCLFHLFMCTHNSDPLSFANVGFEARYAYKHIQNFWKKPRMTRFVWGMHI
jgi:hypothetical protein